MSDDFIEIFRAEAAERLDTIAGLLMLAEQGHSDAGSVHALMREAHTLKGAAGMVGLADVAAHAHAFEDALGPVRASGDPVPVNLVPSLLELVDRMRLGALDVRAPESAVAAPPPLVRVPAEKVDRLLDLVAETIVHRRRTEADEGDLLLDELKDAALRMRMQPLSSISGPLRRAVREAASALGKEVDLVLTGTETELDRAILEELPDVLVHLVRNAVDHGIEPPEERVRSGKPRTGRLEVGASQRGSLVEIMVADDGRGVDVALLGGDEHELAERLAEPGMSTAEQVSEFSGRGVGLDSVRQFATSRGGSLAVRTAPGRGTEIVVTLPFTLALARVLLFERGSNIFALPLVSVDEVLRVDRVLSLAGRPSLDLRGDPVPAADLADVLGADAPALPGTPRAVVMAAGGRRLAALCDRLLGQEEVVVNGLLPPLDRLPGYLGTAVLGDGRIALVLDAAALVQGDRGGRRRATAQSLATSAPEPSKVLVVEDSFTVRELQRSILEASGYAVETAENGRHALSLLDRDPSISLVVSDVDMPELDGFELAAAIRAHPDRGALPVVIVTSRDSDEDRRRGAEAGADAYVVKSAFDQGTLLATVERLIGG
jgi:two-component system, chemotaxis family, sensor kinase CheA